MAWWAMTPWQRKAALLGAGLLLGAHTPAAQAQVFAVAADGTVEIASGQGELGPDAVSDDSHAGEEPGADVPTAALTPLAAPEVPPSFASSLAAAAAQARVSPALLAALVWQESRWHADAVSAKGALGLSQLMPATARALAVDPRDPAANLLGAARYLRQLLDLYDGDVERALAAYNAGPARVERAGGVPPIAETRAYVSAVIGHLAQVKSASFKGATR